MLMRIAQVLTAEELAAIRARLSRAAWVDGRVTAGHQSAKAKNNLQLPEDGADARHLREIVMRALERNAMFMAAALPRHVFPPLFNKYEEGMGFGAHVDNAVRQIGNTAHRIRTDVSATLFLSGPEEYDGGELVIQDTYGEHSVKLPAGDMVIYPASSLHRVAPVKRGARVASFFWIQSMVKDDGERALLFELDRTIAGLDPASDAAIRLTAIYHNLIRKWGTM